jgi:hypothetical protein
VGGGGGVDGTGAETEGTERDREDRDVRGGGGGGTCTVSKALDDTSNASDEYGSAEYLVEPRGGAT